MYLVLNFIEQNIIIKKKNKLYHTFDELLDVRVQVDGER